MILQTEKLGFLREWRLQHLEDAKFCAELLRGGKYRSPEAVSILVQEIKWHGQRSFEIKENVAKIERNG